MNWKKITCLRKCLLSLFALFIGIGVLTAQEVGITGTVTSADDGVPLPGVSVVRQGTTLGTITDINGKYEISVPQGTVLVFSFIGMEKQEIAVGNQTTYDVALVTETTGLNEVVVTALGIRRSEKALGYAMTELKGDDLKTNNINPVASLQGKVAGLEVSNSDGGMFGSAKILIRGASTLGNNNQPIYVIDGIVLDNAISNSGDADWSGNADDFGNALKNLNPDDFETVSVLKGASATALYGSRGLNGAVVITTKSGRAQKGLGISVSQTFGVDHVFKTPDLQNEYGTGNYFGNVTYGKTDPATGAYYKYDNANQFYLNGEGEPTRRSSQTNRHFGPSYSKYSDTMIEDYDGSMVQYAPVKNNYRDAYNVGLNSNTNIAIQGGNEKTLFYSSLSYKYAEGTLPRNSFERLALLVKASHMLTDKVKLEASMSFANSLPKNPQVNLGDYFAQGLFGRSYDTKKYMKDYKGPHGGKGDTNYGDPNGYNPENGLWFSIYENSNTQKETNVRPTLALEVDLTNWMKFRTEGNYNYYYVRGEKKELGQGYANEGGYYYLSQRTKEQTNLNANFLIDKTFGDWSLGGFLRGEYYNNWEQFQSANTNGGLIVPGQYFLTNSKNTVSTTGTIEATKRMYSVAFQASAAWKSQVFVDVTGRNDWSSSLVYTNGTGNYSYFYPSVNGSWLLSETFELPAWVSMGKIRGSWAQVGNDTDAYKINQGYTLSSWTNSNGPIYGLNVPTKAYDPSLKPERKNAWEVGLDWRFLDSRINVDATYYKENTKDQIMEISVPGVSGISGQLINAGDIQNSGVEIALNTIPYQNKDWEWALNFTYTRNENKIIDLHPNVANYINLTGSADYGNYRVSSVAMVGGDYGVLMSDYAPKKNDEGQTIFNWRDDFRVAYPAQSGVIQEVGKITPDFLGSMSTSLRWRDLTVGVSLDARFGGHIASYGSRYGTAYGLTESSLKWRDPEHGGMTFTSIWDGKTYTDGMIPDGVFAEGQEVLTPAGYVDVSGKSYQEAYGEGIVDPVHGSAYQYWSNAWSSGTINDNWFKKVNYIALREISLSYRMPQKVYSKIGASNMSLVLTGRNLGYLLNTMPNNENPESVRGTSATEFRVRSFSPYTANYMFTINVSF